MSINADWYLALSVVLFSIGALGVLMMVPLRRSLIVKEHENLPYPEGTACADVLIVGETGGNLAKRVFAGVYIAIAYKTLMSILGLWKDVPSLRTSAASSGSSCSPSSPLRAAAAASVNVLPRTAASCRRRRSSAVRPSRRAAIRACSVSGTSRSLTSPVTCSSCRP